MDLSNPLNQVEIFLLGCMAVILVRMIVDLAKEFIRRRKKNRG